MPQRFINLHPPVGGVARNLGYQHQPPYTAANALNCWPLDTISGRERVGQRSAFRIAFSGTAGDPVQMIQPYRYRSGGTLVDGLVVAGGGASSDLYYDNSGSLSVTGNGTAGSVRNGILHGRNHLNLFLVADHSRNEEETSSAVLASGSNGTLASSTTFDSASYSDWEGLGVTEAGIIADYCLVIEGGDSNVRPGTYAITAIPGSGSTLTISPDPMLSGTTGSGLVFRLERCPKFLSLASGNFVDGGTVLNQWLQSDVALGFVPSGNPLIEIYRDRAVLAGGVENPRQIYMSRQGAFRDFAYDATDDARAWTGATEGQKAGTMGDVVRGLAAYSDESMLILCSNSIYLMRGDPTWGGSIVQLTDHVGCVGQTAFCKTSEGQVMWMGQNGVYMMEGGGGGQVIPVSDKKLPDELKNLSPATYRVVLAWDYLNNGVIVGVTNKSSGSTTGHWFLDWGNKGWWPMSFGEAGMAPYCASSSAYYATAAKSPTLFGCRDGYVRQFDSSAGVDQGAGTTPAIESYVDIGPFQGGPLGMEGIIAEINGSPAASSGDIDWSIRSGRTAEEAYNASVPTSGFKFGEWNSTGLNYRKRPRVRGAWFVIRLKNGENASWAIEQIWIALEAAGVLKP